MKTISLLALACVACGCSHNEFDVTPDQVSKKMSVMHGGPTGGPIDLKHLPPGALKTEHVFKKGDQLPDGTIADSDRKMVTIQMTKKSPDGKVGTFKTETMTGKE